MLTVPAAGVLLTYALLMISAAIAATFTRSWGRAVALGWTVGMAACAGGPWLSFYRDLPYGPTLILSVKLVFVAALGIRALMPATDRNRGCHVAGHPGVFRGVRAAAPRLRDHDKE